MVIDPSEILPYCIVPLVVRFSLPNEIEPLLSVILAEVMVIVPVTTPELLIVAKVDESSLKLKSPPSALNSISPATSTVKSPLATSISVASEK